MEPSPSESMRFRRVLKQELLLWRSRGLIDESQERALDNLYNLQAVTNPTKRSFLSGLLFFGALLIGCGVISFVAANWQAIPTGAKVTLLLSAMWGTQGYGFYLWRVRAQSALGHSLILLGSLIYGANIGLFGQIFQLQGELYQALLLWGVGVLAVAYALPSLPNGVLALIVTVAGYLIWESSVNIALVPWLGLLLFVPLAYRLRSDRFLQLLGPAFVVCTIFEGAVVFLNKDTGFVLLAVLVLLAGFWLWAYASVPRSTQSLARPLNRQIAFWTVTAVGYCFSFWPVAQMLTDDGSAWGLFFTQPVVVSLLVTAIPGTIWVIRQRTDTKGLWQVAAMALCSVGVLLPAGIPLPVGLAVLWVNVALLAPAAYLLWLGLAHSERRSFLLGSGLCAWIALSRFFEYDTGLLLKSAAFVAVGAAVIGMAIWFEKYLSREVNNA